MASVQRTILATPDRVFAVLADGWTYSDWVVGTVHIRDVDQDWPAPGSALHHKAGPWPLSLQDSSTVVACEPGRSLTLKAGLWPLGQVQVRIDLERLGSTASRVTITEDFEAGPLLFLRNKVNDLVLHRRNVESLRRLADIAEREKSQPICDDLGPSATGV
jgi:Polyketide cyclase / dehydrase and lipid transport